MSFNCGSTISDACVGTTRTLDYGNESYSAINANFFSLVSEVISALTGLQNLVIVLMSDSLTDNMKRGMNALRCASISGLINIWTLFAALYYVARQFGQEAEIQKLVDEGWPYICTCQEDVTNMQEVFGGSSSNSAFFKTCD